MGVFEALTQPQVRETPPAAPQTLSGIQALPERTSWPADLPITEETLAAVREHYDIFVEGSYLPSHLDSDMYKWKTITDGTRGIRPSELVVAELRKLCSMNTYCRRALGLYTGYVFGADFVPTLLPRIPKSVSEEDRIKIQSEVAQVWETILDENYEGWSPAEHGKRAWREGTSFTRVFTTEKYLVLRYIDPELLENPNDPESQGIEVDRRDASKVLKYWIRGSESPVSAADVYRTKVDADAVERFGYSRFSPILGYARLIEQFLITEATHRQMQASIVLVKKVQGGPSSAKHLLNNSVTGTRQGSNGSTVDQYSFRHGTEMIIPKNVDIQFAQPNTNFADASPLAQLLIRQLAVATGWPYEMLSADTSQGNLSSVVSNEGPVGQLVMDERREMGNPILKIFKRGISHAIAKKEISLSITEEELWRLYKPSIQYGLNAQRDLLKQAQALNIFRMGGVFSVAECSRRTGVDPQRMRDEIEEEQELGLYPALKGNQLPSADDNSQSSADNATDGSGTNQGDNTSPLNHKDSA